jgi:hypothetical protein
MMVCNINLFKNIWKCGFQEEREAAIFGALAAVERRASSHAEEARRLF